MEHSVRFLPSGRGSARCPADPNYPEGIDLNCAPPGARRNFGVNVRIEFPVGVDVSETEHFLLEMLLAGIARRHGSDLHCLIVGALPGPGARRNRLKMTSGKRLMLKDSASRP